MLNRTAIFLEAIPFEGVIETLLALNTIYKFEKIDFDPIVKIDTNNAKIPKTDTLPLLKKQDINLPMPTQSAMDEYILKHVFS